MRQTLISRPTTCGMAYAFAKEVSSDFLQSVQIVTGLSLEHVQDLAGVVIGWLSHTGRIDFKGDVAMLAQSLSLPEGVVREATTMLRVFFRGAIRSHLNAAQVRDDLVALGLEADVVDVIVALWETHKSALTAAVVATSVSVNELVDMDWKFGGTYPLCVVCSV